MTTVLFVPHHGRPLAGQTAKAAITRIESQGHRPVVLEADARQTGLEQWAISSVENDRPELAVSLGGDGTMLRTIDLLDSYDIPVLGVNVGHLGYLTEIEPNELNNALDRYFAGDAHIMPR